MVEGDGVHAFAVVSGASAGAGGARSGLVQRVVGVARDEGVLLRSERRGNVVLTLCNDGGGE